MGLLGSAIGAGIGAVGSIFGGSSASKAMRRIRENINQQRKQNNDWYNRRYNEDATQRADAQAILTKTEEAIKNRNRQAAGTQAVMGGTEESVAATKAANSKAMADATSQIAVAGERRKDAIENQYLQNEANLVAQLNDAEARKAQAIAEATKGVTQAASGIAGIL